MQLRSRIFFAILLPLILWPRIAVGQEPGRPVKPDQPVLTASRIDQLRKEADASSELEEDGKQTIREAYRVALAESQRATELKAHSTALRDDADTVAQRVAQTRQELDDLKGREPSPPRGLTLTELEAGLNELQSQLEARKQAQVAAEAEPKLRAGRRKEVRDRMVTIGERIAELTKRIESPAADEHPLIMAARKTELSARKTALEQELPALKNELAKYDAEDAADLLRFQRDLCTQQVALAERQLRLLTEELKRVRIVAAEQAVRKARDEVIAADPVLKSYAERNRHLAELGKSITEQFNKADRELKTSTELYDELFRKFEQTRRKVDSVGLTSSVGALLRQQKAALPDVRRRRTAVQNRRMLIDETQYELFEYDDERQELADPKELVRRILRKVDARQLRNQEVLESAAHELLDRKREYLDALIRNYNKYFDALVELDTKERQIIVLAREYQQYIDERVLWIRSGRVLSSELSFDQSDGWFLSVARWAEIPRRIVGDLRRRSLVYVFALGLLGVLLWRRRRSRRDLRDIGESVKPATCLRFLPTLQATLLTCSIAVVWPALVGFVAWRLGLSANGSTLAKAVGHGLLCVCAVWFPLEFLRQMCRPNGLAEAHFSWSPAATRLLRRQLGLLILLSLPLIFITSTFFAFDPTHGRDGVERTCFILQAFVLALFLRRVLHPSSSVFRDYVAYHQGGWIDRLKFVWYWLGMASPLLLAGLAFWGYYYTALVLSWRLHATMCFVASLVIVRALLLRLILVRRRKLSMEQARERAAASEQNATSSTAGIVTPEPQADVSANCIQTQRLLATGMLASSFIGLWLIWVDVLPALSLLDRWPLWTTSSSARVDEAAQPTLAKRPIPGMGMPATSRSAEANQATITFSDVALAVLIAMITFMSARNVPGLLEMSVLQRLPLDSSVRYALTSLVSYAIVLIGVIIACSTIGLRWSQIQWLATALTFGLAFGLQEIFANFVAGLIILFERPVRVGDVVTVDDVTGVVSRIRIRATSITNWDRKEYVVPNKEFITGRLLNWTLSDKINRIVFNIGIAYGSDTERARELLLSAANEHPMILKDPPSIATFEGFGDNSLNFSLRTFLPTMENRLQVIHELHTAIDQAFRNAGIEIAFPQRDLHLRSMPEALTLGTPHSRQDDDVQQEAA